MYVSMYTRILQYAAHMHVLPLLLKIAHLFQEMRFTETKPNVLNKKGFVLSVTNAIVVNLVSVFISMNES